MYFTRIFKRLEKNPNATLFTVLFFFLMGKFWKIVFIKNIIYPCEFIVFKYLY